MAREMATRLEHEEEMRMQVWCGIYVGVIAASSEWCHSGNLCMA